MSCCGSPKGWSCWQLNAIKPCNLKCNTLFDRDGSRRSNPRARPCVQRERVNKSLGALNFVTLIFSSCLEANNGVFVIQIAGNSRTRALLYGLLLSLWCFSILVIYYFQVSFNLKVIFYAAKITQNTGTGLPLRWCYLVLVQTSKYVLKTLLKSVIYQGYGLGRSWAILDCYSIAVQVRYSTLLASKLVTASYG